MHRLQPEPPEPDLGGLQKERFPFAAARAKEKARSIQISPRVATLLDAARRAKPGFRRLRWIHRAVDAWAESVAPVAACKRGCSHCCHIPVALTTSEALLLASSSDLRVFDTEPEERLSVRELLDSPELGQMAKARAAKTIGTPCPFLVDGGCSVYENRPIACRAHFNLDDDDLLCRLVPGMEASVPYANATALLAASLGLLQGDDVADIRDWFPCQAECMAEDL